MQSIARVMNVSYKTILKLLKDAGRRVLPTITRRCAA